MAPTHLLKEDKESNLTWSQYSQKNKRQQTKILVTRFGFGLGPQPGIYLVKGKQKLE